MKTKTSRETRYIENAPSRFITWKRLNVPPSFSRWQVHINTSISFSSSGWKHVLDICCEFGNAFSKVLSFQPNRQYEDAGCLVADNGDNGKWSLESCGQAKPFVCMFTSEDDKVIEREWKSLIVAPIFAEMRNIEQSFVSPDAIPSPDPTRIMTTGSCSGLTAHLQA